MEIEIGVYLLRDDCTDTDSISRSKRSNNHILHHILEENMPCFLVDDSDCGNLALNFEELSAEYCYCRCKYVLYVTIK